ncbi:hypothetical protein G3N56_07120 [Desulfovibrio sulfodismutans]|uniref:Glyoxalase/fosfomycin resistance/dioxygenase domain-containing protein n=1 Tax=Desulfolutivibrio sulfodismutans TaxID=63561 RepID=A0A7K3NJZ9_9BACT|nr:VOC family protein [Desulfolutivibrio sulfodismutans]NDY56512.1 hypothetical protein [Desulfolutivibrio sulfodismutans]
MPAAALCLDHLVLTVADVDRACAFSTRVMGMRRIKKKGLQPFRCNP